MGHIHSLGLLFAPAVEDRGGLIIVLAFGVFKAVVVVAGGLLVLLPADREAVARLPDGTGIGWCVGFTAADVYCRGGVSRNS